MTPQEIFDTVARHLMSMDGRSYSHARGCLYRDGRGRKCAVGALIPDDMYRPWMDIDMGNGTAIFEVLDHMLHYYPDYFRSNIDLLADLQSVHDNLSHWGPDGLSDKGIGGLYNVAAAHKLSDGVLTIERGDR